MTTSDNRPNPFVTVWAENGLKFETIPELTDDRPNFDGEGKDLHKARATMQEGFPEITMKSAMRGGEPPWGQDHNKILNQITEAIRWMQAGGCAFFNQTLCDKIVGYPKGAILQTRAADENLLFLWFSTKDGNTNNPDTTTSPDNGWVKLDFKDLEKRLKAAEDHIVVIDGRLDGHDSYLGNIDNTLSDHNTRINTNQSNISQNASNITELQKSKAEKEGSCGVPFNADVMKASRYEFCNSPDQGNGYITQNNKRVNFYSDNYMHFCFPSFNNGKTGVPADSALTLEYNPASNLTASYFPASNSYFNGGWIHMQSTLSVENSLTQFTFKNLKAAVGSNKAKDYISWQITVDSRVKDSNPPQETDYPSEMQGDFILSYFSKVYYDFAEEVAGAIIETEKLADNTELKRKVVSKDMVGLRISAENGDVSASGAFIGHNADLAEYYLADRPDYEPGTLMCHGVDTEVTLCQSIDQSDDFFGIVSTSPAYIMNGKGKDETNSVLIALNGKVPVKVKGVVKRGDKITIGQDGYGVVSKNKNDVIVGRAKEDKLTEEVSLVSCYVQAHM